MFGLFKRSNEGNESQPPKDANPFRQEPESFAFSLVEAGGFLFSSTGLERSSTEISKRTSKSALEGSIHITAGSYVTSSLSAEAIASIHSGNETECRAVGTLVILLTAFQCTRATEDHPDIELDHTDVAIRVLRTVFSPLGVDSEAQAELFQYSAKAANELMSSKDERVSQVLEVIDQLGVLYVRGLANGQEEPTQEQLAGAEKMYAIIRWLIE